MNPSDFKGKNFISLAKRAENSLLGSLTSSNQNISF